MNLSSLQSLTRPLFTKKVKFQHPVTKEEHIGTEKERDQKMAQWWGEIAASSAASGINPAGIPSQPQDPSFTKLCSLELSAVMKEPEPFRQQLREQNPVEHPGIKVYAMVLRLVASDWLEFELKLIICDN